MLLLVTSAHPTLQPHRTPSIGRLVQPRHYSSLEQTIRSAMPWAADNDCFQGLSHRRYCLMLDRLQEALIAANDGERRGECWRGRPLFVTVPDVVADCRTTAHLWGVWAHAVRRRGLPLAFVAQNGCDRPNMSPPWYEFDAVFIGGDTAWKLGPEARRIVRICKEHKSRSTRCVACATPNRSASTRSTAPSGPSGETPTSTTACGSLTASHCRRPTRSSSRSPERPATP